MLAEIISIGDELTSGQRLDTNSQWLSTRLGELGVEVRYHTTVADDLDANVRVFREAIERADILVATGGLGPTADDLTRDALAATSGQPLVLDAASLAHIEALFARRRRAMPESNRLQAMFPAGSRVIANPTGSAPGIDLDVARPGFSACRVFALPGVPSEMKRMWSETVAPPAIAAMFPTPRLIRHRRIKCFGVGESDLEAMLPDLIRRGREPKVGITVSMATITLRITAEGASEAECFAAMEPTVATIRECLGNLVFGEEDDELEHAVVRLLAAQGKTLATVERGTGGLLAHWLGEVPEAVDRYLGGVIVRSREAGRLLLEPGWLHDSLRAVVEADAAACQQRMAADFAIATGPAPAADPSAPSPDFWYALATPEGVQVRSSPYGGPPDILKPRAAKQTLNWLRLKLLRAE